MRAERKKMDKSGRNAGSCTLPLLLGIVLVGVLVWTNPPREKHLAKVWAVATEEAYEDSAWPFRLIGLPFIEGTDTALKLEVLNLGICSVGYSDGDPSAFSFGALGGVVAFAWWK